LDRVTLWEEPLNGFELFSLRDAAKAWTSWRDISSKVGKSSYRQFINSFS